MFWNKDESFDVDANLRVSISNLRKIFKGLGHPDIIVSELGKLYINKQYEIGNDYKKLVAVYQKGKALYKSKDYFQAEIYLVKIIKIELKNIFKDISWDYLEEKIFNQVNLIFYNSLEMLLFIAKVKNNLLKAKEYCRKLIGVKPQYKVELARLQKELGEIEEKKTGRETGETRRSLTDLFVVD